MDVKNSRGRTVSLLNEDLPRLSNLPRVNESQSHLHFANSKPYPQPPASFNSTSIVSTPTLSTPPTSLPPLSRSASSDSRSFLSPGPTTPPGAGLGCAPNLIHQHENPSIDAIARIALSDQDDKDEQASPMDYTQQQQLPPGSSFGYPNIALPPNTGTTFDPSALQTQSTFPQPSPLFEQQAQAAFSTPMSSTSQRPQKKNTYPCPLSKNYNCNEYFTTSGHAARHAKKHTGKKDAICSECGKGFTRKDNMEQHKRTHASGRNATSGSSTVASSSTTNGENNKSTTIAKSVPKEITEESKARKKTQQQRKARPASISTAVPVQMQVPQPIMQQPMTTTSVMPPQVDLLDPALREHAALFADGFSNTLTFPTIHQQSMPGQNQQYSAPHAPMQRQAGAFQRPAALDSSSTSMRTIPEPMVTDQELPQHPLHGGPTSPSLAPKLDALALAAEDVRRRDSDDST